MKKQFIKSVLALLVLLSVLMAGCGAEETETTAAVETTEAEVVVTLGPQAIDDPTEATTSETPATLIPESEPAETTAPAAPETTEVATEPSEEGKGPIKPTLGAIEID